MASYLAYLAFSFLPALVSVGIGQLELAIVLMLFGLGLNFGNQVLVGVADELFLSRTYKLTVIFSAPWVIVPLALINTIFLMVFGPNEVSWSLLGLWAGHSLGRMYWVETTVRPGHRDYPRVRKFFVDSELNFSPHVPNEDALVAKKNIQEDYLHKTFSLAFFLLCAFLSL